MGSMPDAIFVIDTGHENIAIKEAEKLGIPVVGIVDTNNSPRGIDYVIPGNDDAIRSIKLYVQAAADAILEGRSSNVVGTGDDEFVAVEEDTGAHVKARIKTKGSKKIEIPDEDDE